LQVGRKGDFPVVVKGERRALFLGEPDSAFSLLQLREFRSFSGLNMPMNPLGIVVSSGGM
jgi:hypothetical protein